MDYDKYSGYDESYKRGEGYSLESYNNISGSGFDVKMGLILRPFEYSPFRIGFAVHTPTFYKLTYSTSAIVTNDYRDAKTDELIQPDNTYHILGNQFTVATLDLNQPFDYIA